MNELLSLAIPTHNRFEILRENLLELAPELIETGVGVHLSDSGTDGITEARLGELQRIVPGLHYRRRPGLLYDANCLSALGMPATEYVWYLGDSLRILPGGVRRMLAALRETPCDFAVVTLAKRGPVDLAPGLHRDHLQVLERLAWHMTLAGSTVYARAHLVDAEARYARFLGCNFSHLGIVLDRLPGCQRGLLWLGETWLAGNQRRRSAWVARSVEIFARDWAAFVLSLPDDYPLASKHVAIRAHSLHTGILEWRSLGRLRRKGFLDPALVRLHERSLRLASGVPYPAIERLAGAPRWLAGPLSRLGRLGLLGR